MELTRDQMQFIDDFAAQWERAGANVAQGRVLALLYIVPGGEATAIDIVEALGISRGAASQVTRQLIQMHFVQRRSRPGDRRDWFRISPNPFGEAARAERQHIQPFIDLFRRGLALHTTSSPEDTRALANSIAFLQDYDAAIGDFLASWRPPDELEHP